MYYASMRPQWPTMNNEGSGEGGRGGHRGGRGEGRGGRGFGFGGHGPMGPIGPGGFGPGRPGGPFGPGGFGPGGFGPGGFGGFGGDGHGGRRGRARRGDVRQAILALLAEAPMNGYQIIQALAERTGGIWKPSPGAIYPALNQLTDEGLIEAHEAEGFKGFRLTEAGAAAAAQVEVKPWDTVNDESGRNAEGAAGLWHEFGALASALRSATVAGSPAQLKAAAELLAETRRKLFGLLAEEQPPQA